MQVLAISDLHTDFAENMRLVESIEPSSHQDDVLIVAGDIADQAETIGRTLALLRSRFKMVFFVPGNHELWVRNESSDSVEKLFKLMSLCDSLDVRHSAAKVDGVWIVPLFS